jgi:hypothetical protein
MTGLMINYSNTGDFPEIKISTLLKPPYILVEHLDYPHK